MRRRTGIRARLAVVPANIINDGPELSALAGRPARCASNIHRDRRAEVYGTFLNSAIRNGDPDRPNVGYCTDCATVLTAVGWFRPDPDCPSRGATQMITDEMLEARIIPALAAERAMTVAERATFAALHLAGQFNGAQVADWIDEALNCDAYLGPAEKWWAQNGDAALAQLVDRHQLPERITQKTLYAALYATLALVGGDLNRPHRSTLALAHDAALWARGYADALGWYPTTTTDAR